MLVQDNDSQQSILRDVADSTGDALKELKSWFYPYMYNSALVGNLSKELIPHFPFFSIAPGAPTHSTSSASFLTSVSEDYEKIKKKIENDDSNNNYVFHIQTKETLMENVKLDASLHLKIDSVDATNPEYDHTTASFMPKDAYSYLDSGVTNFYKADTYYHHWQLKDNVLLDPVNNKDIAFINDTKIFSLNTDLNTVSEVCDFRHKIVNFDISADFIVACGYRVMSSYPREHTSLFFNKFHQPVGKPSHNITTVSSLGREIVFIPSDEQGKHYVACTKKDMENGTLDKGVIFVHNRKTGITYEFSVGAYMNNTARILNNDLLAAANNFLVAADLKVLVTNNDGFLYYLAFSNLDFEIVKIKMLMSKGSFSYESVNNIAIDDAFSHVVVTTDSNYFMSFKINDLMQSLVNHDNGSEMVLRNNIHFASSGSFAMNAIFLKNSLKVVVSYQNGRVHITDLSNSGVQNIILPFRSFEEAIRNVVVDSKNNIYISKSSGAVHIYTAEQLLADADTTSGVVVHHKQLNFPKTSYLNHLEDISLEDAMIDAVDNQRGFIKQKVAPYLSTSYDLYNVYSWFKDRNNVIAREKASPYRHTLSAIFLDCMQDKKSHKVEVSTQDGYSTLDVSPSLQAKLLNEMYEQLFELERIVMLEQDNHYVGVLGENEVKVNRYINAIAKLYPETFQRIMTMCECDLTKVLPFDKIMTRSYIPYKYDLDQYAKLHILKRDCGLFKNYVNKFGNKNKNFVMNTPHHPSGYIFTDKSEVESQQYEELITETQDEPVNVDFKKQSFGNAHGEYEDYQFCVFDAFKSTKMDKKHRYEDRSTNKITGMAVRTINNEEQLIVGTSTGIYTIPI